MHRNMHLIHYSMSNLKKVLMFSFCYTILLRSRNNKFGVRCHDLRGTVQNDGQNIHDHYHYVYVSKHRIDC